MSKKEFVKLYKRFFIAFACCLPIFILIGVFLTKYIGDALTIVIYCVIGSVAFILAEIIHKKRQVKLEAKREKARLKRKYKNVIFDEEQKIKNENQFDKKNKQKKSNKN